VCNLCRSVHLIYFVLFLQDWRFISSIYMYCKTLCFCCILLSRLPFPKIHCITWSLLPSIYLTTVTTILWVHSVITVVWMCHLLKLNAHIVLCLCEEESIHWWWVMLKIKKTGLNTTKQNKWFVRDHYNWFHDEIINEGFLASCHGN